MKRLFIVLAAIAALSIAALCLGALKMRGILFEKVNAQSEQYCVYDPPKSCILAWYDGDYYFALDYSKQGMDETWIIPE